VKIEDYMNPGLFPLTTQLGLTVEQQMLLDAMNYDDVVADESAGVSLSENDQAVANELKAKHAARESVLEEIRKKKATTLVATPATPPGV